MPAQRQRHHQHSGGSGGRSAIHNSLKMQNSNSIPESDASDNSQKRCRSDRGMSQGQWQKSKSYSNLLNKGQPGQYGRQHQVKVGALSAQIKTRCSRSSTLICSVIMEESDRSRSRGSGSPIHMNENNESNLQLSTNLNNTENFANQDNSLQRVRLQKVDYDLHEISLRQQRRIDQILSSHNMPGESPEGSLDTLKLLDSHNTPCGLQKLSMRNNTPDIPDKLFKTPNSSDQLEFL